MPEKENDTQKPFIISRTFSAPRQRVWDAWTRRENLMRWFGPKGVTITTANLDLRPGGFFHYAMRTPDGKEMWGKFLYQEIVEPEKIVLINHFSDAAGGITRHPFSASWPLKMLATTTFAEHDGKTTLTIHWIPLEATADERKTFDQMHGSMNQGWSGTFQQLEEFLAQNA